MIGTWGRLQDAPWSLVWKTWAAGSFLLAGKRKQPHGHTPGAD